MSVPIINASEMLASPPPKIDWLIDTVWPNGVGFVAGEPEQGKTWFTLDMAVSIVSNTPFLYEYKPKRSGPILFIEEEQSLAELHQRLDLLLRGKKLSREHIKSFYCAIQGGIKFPQNADKIIEFVQKYKCVAVFIDSFRRLHRQDEISSTDLQPVLDSILRIKLITKASVIMIHHLSKPQPGASKNPLNRLRGSGDLLAWADTVIGLMPTDHGSHKLIFKMRGAPKPEDLTLVRTFDPIDRTVVLRREII